MASTVELVLYIMLAASQDQATLSEKPCAVKTHLGALTLTQRDLLKLFGEAQLICQLEQVCHGISTRGQNKDEGCGIAGIQEGASQVEGGRLSEAGA